MTRGEDAEARFLAHTRREGGVGSNQERERVRDRGGGRDREGGSPFAPLGRDEFHLLRVESDNFVNRVDVSDSPLRQRGPSSPSGKNAVLGSGDKNIPGVGGVSGHGGGEGSACPSSSWDGSLPPRAVLVADGFLVPGKADGGVYVVIPSLSEEGTWRGDGGGGEDSQSGGRRREQDYADGRVVRLTKMKRSGGVEGGGANSRCSATGFPEGQCVYVSRRGRAMGEKSAYFRSPVWHVELNLSGFLN